MMNESHSASLADFREEFEFLDNRLDRLEALIRFGDSLECMPMIFKTESTKVPGCESSVWAYPKLNENGTLHFYADSNAATTKGIIAIIIHSIQDKYPKEIAETNIEELLKPFDVQRYLTSKRTSGIPNMIALIRDTAERYAA